MKTVRLLCGLLWMVSCVRSENPYFWQINDIHYDSYYWLSQASCNEVIEQPGAYGDYLCDAPWSLVQSSVQALKQHGPAPSFILWSGDLLAHFKNDTGYVSDDYLLDVTRNVTDLLRDTFPGVRILPVIGNHDYVPRSQLPDTASALYEALGDLWEPILGEAQAVEQFKQGGYYTMQLSETPPVRALVPNSNYYYTSNALELGEDPGGQFVWMEDTLREARTQGEKVYIFTHISPGILEVAQDVNFFRPSYNARFLGLLRSFSDVILGVFTGHSHFDSFKLIYEDDEAVSSIFIAPSVTPWQARIPNQGYGNAHNPAVRQVHLSASDASIQDIVQFYLDLPAANRAGRAEWSKLYEFKELYGLEDMSARSLQGLVESFNDEDSGHFETYYDMNSVHVDADTQRPCDCTCKSNHVCAIKHVGLEEYARCMEERGGVCSGAGAIKKSGDIGAMVVIWGLLSLFGRF